MGLSVATWNTEIEHGAICSYMDFTEIEHGAICSYMEY